jgi:23S rRNA (uracil1939-C5)-methyltransferase
MSDMEQRSPSSPEMELDIIDLAAGGRGLARQADGRVVFVAGALKGEKVSARVVAEKRQYLEAETIQVLEASPDRVEPACAHYGRCGGCDLMHLAYPAQVQAKADWAVQSLQRLDMPGQPEIQPSPMEWGYRHRVRFQVKDGVIGFFARASHELVEVAYCPVAASGINNFLDHLSGGVLAEWPNLVWLEVLTGYEGQVLAAAGLESMLPDESLNALKQALGQAGATGARLYAGERAEAWTYDQGSGLVYYEEEGLSLRAYPGIFSQVNWPANELLIAKVVAAAGEPWGQERALDLYAGAGNFALPLAAREWGVLAVEGDAQAVKAGRELSRETGLDQAVIFSRGQVGREVGNQARAGETCELAVLDPPRAGAKGLMKDLAALNPQRVIYVSCHAAALARDAARLIDAGYHISDLCVIDMFPQTSHLESVLVLERNDA